MTRRLSAAVAGIVALTILAGCGSGDTRGSQVVPMISPTGPLSVRWGAPGTSQMCFPGTAHSGTVTIGGHAAANDQSLPITLVDYRPGAGSANVDILARLVIPVYPEEDGGTLLFGSWPSYPPGELVGAEYLSQFSRAVSAEGFEMASSTQVEFVVGLKRVDESRPALLTYLDIVYEYDGSQYHVFTPTTVSITGSIDECP